MTEIIHGLHMGSQYLIEDIPSDVDIIVTLNEPDKFANVPTVYIPLDDGPYLPDKTIVFLDIVKYLSSLVSDGKVVFVGCQAGQNRSGLVVGLIMKRLGYTGAEVVGIIQRKRSMALNNDFFRGYLLNG